MHQQRRRHSAGRGGGGRAGGNSEPSGSQQTRLPAQGRMVRGFQTSLVPMRRQRHSRNNPPCSASRSQRRKNLRRPKAPLLSLLRCFAHAVIISSYLCTISVFSCLDLDPIWGRLGLRRVSRSSSHNYGAECVYLSGMY
jgi:hypothetical protein